MKKEIKKKKQLNTAALNFLSMDNNTIRHLWWKMMLWSWGCLAKNAKANLIGFAVKSSQQLVVPQKAFSTRVPLIHLVFSDSLSILISLDTVLAVSRLGYARYVMGGSRTSIFRHCFDTGIHDWPLPAGAFQGHWNKFKEADQLALKSVTRSWTRDYLEQIQLMVRAGPELRIPRNQIPRAPTARPRCLLTKYH